MRARRAGNEGAPVKWWYQRTKIVAWPRHKRIAILGLKAAMHLLRTAVGGDNDALACYTDAATLQQYSGMLLCVT